MTTKVIGTGRTAEALAHPEVAARWEEPSRLDEMTVGAVAAHVAAGLDRFEALLAGPEPDGPDHDLAAFYGANRIEGQATASADPLHAFIRDDGAERAAAGPAAVLAGFRDQVERLRAVLPIVPDDRWVATARVPGRTSLATYLPTRAVELAVHTDDLLASVGVEQAPVRSVADVVLGVALVLARAGHGDLAVLRAAYRGGPSVLPVL